MQDRVGMFNKPSEKININSPDPNSDIYISEGERFNKDFAAYDYNRRNLEHERKKEIYQNRKNILYERERKRWEKMDYEYLKAENKIMMNKERNLVGRKNNPGMAFNPLTLQYDNSVQGEILKRRDDESKFRALMRATNIDKHANAGYNIINGEERTIMENRMRKEIEPSVYQKNIDKINEINQRHNDNDNFYTKGPYSQPKTQFQQMPLKNEYMDNNPQINNNEYQQMPTPQRENEFKQMPPENNYQNMGPGANENNKEITPNNFNNIAPNEYQRMSPNNNMPSNDYKRMTPNNNNFNNIPPNENYQQMPYNDNNYNNIPPNDNNYQRMTPSNNNFNNIPPNMVQNDNNYERNTPNNNYNTIQENRNYRRTPHSENNYGNGKMTPSNQGYNQMPPNEQMIPDHYSEQDKRVNNNMHDFDRQYNYMGYPEQNNYEDYKNQDYNNGKQTPNNYYPQSEDGFNRNRDPYARPDYYANNRPQKQ